MGNARKDPSSDRMKRKQAATRAAIIKAALELFEEEPYRNVTIARIMERADYAVGTYYSFFSDKDDLVLSATRELMMQAGSLMANVPEDMTARQRIELVMHETASVIAENLTLFALFFAIPSTSKTETDSTRTKHAEGSLAMLVNLFEAGVQAGEFGADTPSSLVAELLQSSLQPSSRLRKGEAFVRDIDAKTEFVLDAIEVHPNN